MEDRIYKINGPKYWSTKDACFITEQEALDSGLEIVYLITAEGVSNEAYLYKTLKFYGYKLGELATPVDAIDEVIESNKDYLLKMLIMSVLDIEIPNKALAYFNELKKELRSFSSEAVSKFLVEKN